MAARIAIEKAAFFELIAALRTHELHRLEAQIAQRTAEASGQKGQALLEALAKLHGFDSAAPFGFDEATCELIPR